jgi:hypothetical protein
VVDWPGEAVAETKARFANRIEPDVPSELFSLAFPNVRTFVMPAEKKGAELKELFVPVI